MAGQPGELPKPKKNAEGTDWERGPDGRPKMFWADGTEVSQAEGEALNRAAQGDTPESGAADTQAWGTSPIDRYLNDMAPKQVAAGAPGATLDVTNANDERGRLEGLLGRLQQQAATGGGEWEKTLADATQRAQATAQALGQSNPNVGYQSALRNIGNAQASSAQRAVGQADILRAQGQQGAQSQMANALAGQGAQDIEQARLDAAARQQRRATNAELVRSAKEQVEGTLGAVGSIFMSDGGHVPGRAQVFGDDEANDTVPAMLSPGEIVVPRSKVGSPDEAAEFARAVAMRSGQRMADGGETGLEGMEGPSKDEIGTMIFAPHLGIADYYRRIGLGPQAPSIENGGLLDASNFEANRARTLGLADQLAGPGNLSVAPQMAINAQDDTIAGTMAQTQQAAAASGAANALQAAVAQQQGAAGDVAAAAGNEQAKRQALGERALSGQRGRDLAMALAQQQAGWRNTAMNAGLSLRSQQDVTNAISGGAQAIGALTHGGGDEDDDDDDGGFDLDSDEPDDDSYAKGGVVKDDERRRIASFLGALRRAS